tara:strand:+ start:58 stop:552 length:495 start_codon:yes stop_codon:yes gene_type:complete
MPNELYTNSKFFENRGNIYSIYKAKDFDVDFAQDKISKSYQGVIRGFHADKNTWKLITCIQGKVKFITYDFRTDEKNQYILDGDSGASVSVLIPPDILNAHQCLSPVCIFHYKWSEYYEGTNNQRAVHYNDPDINPNWDEEFGLIVSERDQVAGSLKELKKNAG